MVCEGGERKRGGIWWCASSLTCNLLSRVNSESRKAAAPVSVDGESARCIAHGRET